MKFFSVILSSLFFASYVYADGQSDVVFNVVGQDSQTHAPEVLQYSFAGGVVVDNGVPFYVPISASTMHLLALNLHLTDENSGASYAISNCDTFAPVVDFPMPGWAPGVGMNFRSQCDVTLPGGTQHASVNFGATAEYWGNNPGAEFDANGNVYDARSILSNLSSNTAELISCPGDANGDGIVNLSDLLLLTRNFGKTNTGGPSSLAIFGPYEFYSDAAVADFDLNGVVDINDYLLLVRNYGKTCFSLQSAATAAASSAVTTTTTAVRRVAN